ncbi:hypothetical protein Tco_0527298 [Tanacetum coccineum]
MLVWILGSKSVERASILNQPDGVGSQRHHIVPIGELNGVSIALVARFIVRVVEENRRIHEDMELKRRSKLKLMIFRHLFTVLAITRSYELGLSWFKWPRKEN